MNIEAIRKDAAALNNRIIRSQINTGISRKE
jgi:hypothetical protein